MYVSPTGSSEVGGGGEGGNGLVESETHKKTYMTAEFKVRQKHDEKN